MMSASLAAQAALIAPLASWFSAVDHNVPQPYLDEIFHIPQGQHFCNGRFDIWDPKITTPPGVYLMSYLLRPLLGCSVTALRLVNAACLVALCFVIHLTYITRARMNNETSRMHQIFAGHSALNVALFPPIFFFSALYYTDVPSTLSVAVFYYIFLVNQQKPKSSLAKTSLQMLAAVASLWFRQTNIFWVGLAPLLLVAVHQVDRGRRDIKTAMYRHRPGFGDTTWNIVKASWQHETVYDPPVRDASLEEYVRSALSIATCAVRAVLQPKRLLPLMTVASPHLAIIAIFAAFIIWNGGVVLGDKSAHLATINLPQMLYLWPYLAFFSWPLVLPQFLLLPITFLSRVSRFAHFEPLLVFRRQQFLPRKRVILSLILLACVVVRVNTVIHPYLLADNRHYPFYVFKRLLHPWWVRYAVTPIYIFCGWACIESRGEALTLHGPQDEDNSEQSSRKAAKEHADAQSQTNPSSSSSSTAARRPIHLPDGRSSAVTSFILVWLATTTVQLSTAPLFEPRYLIVPWLFWRIHLPLRANDDVDAPPSQSQSPSSRRQGSASLMSILPAYDLRVVLETAWYLCVNALTGYVFLYRTFTWLSEPGQKQRFMY